MSRYLSDAKAHALDLSSAVKILAISKSLFIPDVIAKKKWPFTGRTPPLKWHLCTHSASLLLQDCALSTYRRNLAC
jgi:hypothetical protein